MKKIIALIISVAIAFFVINIVVISRNDIIKILEENSLKNSPNVRVIEKEIGNFSENYQKETSKLENIEYCKNKMLGEENYSYINWVNLTENEDIVVFISDKIFNTSTMDVQAILENYSEKTLEYLKDKSYKYKYMGKEEINTIECMIVSVYNSNKEENIYEEIKVWISLESNDVIKMEKYLNESSYTKPDEPISILELEYLYDSVKAEDIIKPTEEDYPDFSHTILGDL